jgi:hypothetical protein
MSWIKDMGKLATYAELFVLARGSFPTGFNDLGGFLDGERVNGHVNSRAVHMVYAFASDPHSNELFGAVETHYRSLAAIGEVRPVPTMP